MSVILVTAAAETATETIVHHRGTPAERGMVPGARLLRSRSSFARAEPMVATLGGSLRTRDGPRLGYPLAATACRSPSRGGRTEICPGSASPGSGMPAVGTSRRRSSLTLGNAPFYSSGSGQDCSQQRVFAVSAVSGTGPAPKANPMRPHDTPGVGIDRWDERRVRVPPVTEARNRLQRTVCHLPSESVPTGVETVRKRRCQRSS